MKYIIYPGKESTNFLVGSFYLLTPENASLFIHYQLKLLNLFNKTSNKIMPSKNIEIVSPIQNPNKFILYLNAKINPRGSPTNQYAPKSPNMIMFVILIPLNTPPKDTCSPSKIWKKPAINNIGTQIFTKTGSFVKIFIKN